MAEDVLPAVKDSSALLAVQLVDEVSGEVLVAVLVPETQTALKVKPPGSTVHLGTNDAGSTVLLQVLRQHDRFPSFEKVNAINGINTEGQLMATEKSLF